MFQFFFEFIFLTLKVMVTCCKFMGCAINCSNAPTEGFFCLPSIVNPHENLQILSRQRCDVWLSRINGKDLTASHLPEKNSTLYVWGRRSISSRPAALFEPLNSDRAPNLNLGYKKLSVISSQEMQEGKAKWKFAE